MSKLSERGLMLRMKKFIHGMYIREKKRKKVVEGS